MVRGMQIRPAAEHAELQDPSADLEVKAARRKWNPSLHPRDSKGRFIETGGTVRLWGGKLARVVRALPNDRILVQDQTAPNEFNGRRHTTSAKWVSMVARPDGTAPTDNENKVQEEDEKRTVDPRRGNGVALDDDGDPDTPNDPHDVDDRGRPIGDDEGDGPEPGDDQDERDETANRRHEEGARFADTEAVRRHFAQLSHRVSVPNPLMARFLAEASNAHDLRTSRSGRLAILQDDQTRRWYLSATGTGGRMSDVGDFATPEDADRFADHLESTLISRHGEPFDFSDPDLEAWANAWHSRDGKNIVDALTAARAAFDGVRPPKRKPARDKPTRRPAPAQDPAPDAQADAVQNAPMSEPPGDQEPNSSRPTPAAPAATGEPSATVSRGALKPGDRVKVTVPRSHIEWPASTRGQEKPETVIVEGTVTPTYQPGWRSTGAPLVDVTLTAPDGTEMASGETAYVMRMPDQVTVSGNTEGFAPEEMRADRVRVGDVIAEGTFGQVVTDVRRYPGGRSFTTRHLGGTRQVDGFSVRPERMLSVVPKARRRPEDVQRDIPNRTQQHPNSTDAKRAAAGILGDWSKVNELAEQQWPDGAPEEFRALAQHMQKVTDTPKGADGYHKNAEAMRGALSALDELDADSVNRDLMEALHRLEEHLDANVDRFEADARAITENKRKREAEANAPKPDAPEANAPADQPGTPTSGEPEPYDPTYQQQTDERGRLTYYRTPQGVSRDIGGRFGVGEPVRSPGGDTYIVASGNDDGTINTRKAPLRNEGPLGRSETFPADELQSMDGFRPWRLDAREAEADGGTPSPNDPGVTLSPDEVNAPAPPRAPQRPRQRWKTVKSATRLSP